MVHQDWQEYLVIVADHLEKKEKYQKTLGQISNAIVEAYGSNSLQGFADEIAENYGMRISPKTLANYGWVWKNTKDLDLPEDIGFQVYQLLAGVEDKEKYVKRIINEGMSTPQAAKMIKEGKGVKPKTRKFICSSCGAPNEAQG